MLGNPFKTVATGDPLRIPAAAYNAFIAAAMANRQGRVGDASSSGARFAYEDALCKQSVLSFVPRFGVLGLADPAVLPSGNLDSFADRLVFDSASPAGDGGSKFCVLLQPTPEDTIVRCVIDGPVAVLLSIVNENHRYAAQDAGQSDWLKTAARGPAEILWKQAIEDRDVSDKAWGIVRLGADNKPGDTFDVLCTIDGGSAGDATHDCSFTYTVKDLLGWQLGTGLRPKERVYPNTPYTTTPDNTVGLAYYDQNGALQLWSANELADTEECAAPAETILDGGSA